jgi:hypothetical protein
VRRRRPDIASLVTGLGLLAFGGVLAADAAGAVTLTFAALGPMALGAVGAILLAVGLTRED